MLSQYFGLSLRDQQQACAMLDAIRLTTAAEIHVIYMIYLVMLRLVDGDNFDSVCIGRPKGDENLGNDAKRSIEVSYLDMINQSSNTGYPSQIQSEVRITTLISVYLRLGRAPVIEISKSLHESASMVQRNIFGAVVGRQNQFKEISSYPQFVRSAAGLIQ